MSFSIASNLKLDEEVIFIMRIAGPKSVRIKELNCRLFKTRTKKTSEKLYLSIKKSGIKEPLLVAPIKKKVSHKKVRYEIVDGFRRYSVAKDLGLKEVQALIIEDAREKELQEIALLRNTLQTSLSPIEKALYIRKLKNSYNYKNVELASLLGVQKSYITELLKIFKLGEWAIRKLKQKQGFTVSHARILSRYDGLVHNKDKLREIIKKVMAEGWSRARLRYELRKLGYLEDTEPYINVDGLFNRMNNVLNQNQGRFTKNLEIHFDNLWELREKLMQVSNLLSRFAEFLPEETGHKKFTR